MKIVRYLARGIGEPCWGCLENDAVVALESDPLEGKRRAGKPVLLREARLIAPCRPGKVVGLAINYEGATGLTPEMKEPLVFLKPGSSVCGPGDPIECGFSDVQVWGEAELAIVIGRRLRRAAPEEAAAGILGYTAANDVSATNVEDRDHHLARSKAADDFCPLGPWIDTEFVPKGQTIEGFQNKELIRKGTLDQRLWGDAKVVSWLSGWMTLEPWDVILTGTPSRVVPRRYLRDGDEFLVRIDGLGELRNTFKSKTK